MQLGDMVAGARIDTLSFSVLNEALVDTPSEGGKAITGKVNTGWMRKARKAVIADSGASICLPAFDVPATVCNSDLQTAHQAQPACVWTVRLLGCIAPCLLGSDTPTTSEILS